MYPVVFLGLGINDSMLVPPWLALPSGIPWLRRVIQERQRHRPLQKWSETMGQLLMQCLAH